MKIFFYDRFATNSENLFKDGPLNTGFTIDVFFDFILKADILPTFELSDENVLFGILRRFFASDVF
jgi:hypothetical protein